MYSDYKIYGPYTGKDNRQRVVLVNKVSNTRKTVSYPKYLIEESIGRFLEADEQIHHIDEDVTNNDLSNLSIVKIGDHQRQHNPPKYIEQTAECVWCHSTFAYSTLHQKGRTEKRNQNRMEPFCSRKCTGEYGKSIQMGTSV